MQDSKHTQNYRAKHLAKGDTIVATADGYTGKLLGSGADKPTHGSLIVTSRTVAFYRKGWFGEVNETIPLAKISSVEQKSLMGFRSIRLHTANDDLTFTTSNPADRYAAVVAAIENGRASTGHGQGAAPPSASPMEAIQQLAALRTAGVLSDAEFEAKKRELLARI